MNHSEEYIRVKKKPNGDVEINGQALAISFTDKETNQLILFIPSLEISAYGKTESEAKEMLESCLNSFSASLASMSRKEFESELSGLGWFVKPRKNKEFYQKINPRSRVQEMGINDYQTQEIRIAA